MGLNYGADYAVSMSQSLDVCRSLKSLRRKFPFSVLLCMSCLSTCYAILCFDHLILFASASIAHVQRIAKNALRYRTYDQ